MKKEQELKDFLTTININVVMTISTGIIRRAGELHAKYIERGGKRKRILADFIIGAYAEQYADIFVTWNPEDFELEIPVKTPEELIKEIQT